MFGIRPVAVADAAEIAAIYNPEVTTSTVTFDLVARSIEAQQTWIMEHSGSYPAIVAVDVAAEAGTDEDINDNNDDNGGGSGEVVGFASLSPYRPRPAYATTVECSVYVRRDRQGLGVGAQLMEALIGLGQAHGFHSIIARIVGGHEASIALHKKVGFAVVGTEVEVGRKFGKWLDVVVMQRML